MLARLTMKLNCRENFSQKWVPLFHGALMELLSPEYATELHQSRLHPYSQHLEFREGEWYWVVNCLNEKALQAIIKEGLLGIDAIHIKSKDIFVEIGEKEYEELPQRELLNHFYNSNGSRYIEIHFITPTAFKQRGNYLFYPDIRCIYQSLMNKYDEAVREENMIDEDTLEQLCQNSSIIRYDIKSTGFIMGGISIPSYIGKVTLKLSGTQTMADFANLLFTFGTYSGVGIKTSLGMGAFKLLEGGGKRDRRSD